MLSLSSLHYTASQTRRQPELFTAMKTSDLASDNVALNSF